MIYDGPIEAPIKKDQVVAKLKIIYDQEQIGEYNLLALNDVKKVNTFNDNRELAIFTSAIKQLVYNINNKETIRIVSNRLAEIDFLLQQDEMNVYVNDNRVNALRGLFVISKNSTNDVIISVPHPLSERLASNSSDLLFTHSP